MIITNDQIAHDVMGWHLSRDGDMWLDDNGHGVQIVHSASQNYGFDPLHDYNHCRLVEERISALGIIEEYMMHLDDVLRDQNIVKSGMSTWIIGWHYQRATAEQRCEAAYRAWQEWNDVQ